MIKLGKTWGEGSNEAVHDPGNGHVVVVSEVKARLLYGEDKWAVRMSRQSEQKVFLEGSL